MDKRKRIERGDLIHIKWIDANDCGGWMDDYEIQRYTDVIDYCYTFGLFIANENGFIITASQYFRDTITKEITYGGFSKIPMGCVVKIKRVGR